MQPLLFELSLNLTSDQEPTHANWSAASARYCDSVRIKSLVDRLPARTRLDRCNAFVLVVCGAVHHGQINGNTLSDIRCTRPGGMTTTAHGKWALCFAGLGQSRDNERDILCRVWLYNTRRVELNIDRKVRCHGLIVCSAGRVKDLITQGGRLQSGALGDKAISTPTKY